MSTLRLWLSRRIGPPGRRRGPVLVPVHVVGAAAGSDVVFEVLLAGGRTLRFPRGASTRPGRPACSRLASDVDTGWRVNQAT